MQIVETGQLCTSYITRHLYIHKKYVATALFFTVCMGFLLPRWVWILIMWFFAGILSSIGLGTGIHTGILFLTPWVIRVATESSTITSAWFTVLPAVVSHGVGGAFGELPPYYLANQIISRTDNSYIKRSHVIMVDTLKKHGAIIIFLFAIWPNAFFDMCGLAAGASNIPVGVFLASTIAGKALVKSPLIALTVISATKGAILPGIIQKYVDSTLHGNSNFGTYWTIVVGCITTWMVWETMKDVAEKEKKYMRLSQEDSSSG